MTHEGTRDAVNRSNRILLSILLIGFLIRAAGLSIVPPALNSDELLKAFDGASVYRTGMDHHGDSWPLFFKQSGEYSPSLYIYFAGLFSTLFGVNEYTVRLPSAILGAASILVVFLFIRQFWGEKTALIAATLVAFSPWHVHYSRIGWEAISLVPLQLLALWQFHCWSKTNRWRHILISVSCFGLTMYAYPVARLSSVMLMAGLAAIHWRALIKNPKQVSVSFALFILWLCPYLYVLSQNHAAMQARWNFVSVFNRDDGLLIFIQQYFMHLSPDFLFIRGNPNSMHSLAGGLALCVLLPFFIAGLVRIIQHRSKEELILLFWFITFAIPASLTYDKFDPNSMPNALRTVNGMPILEIISAIGIVWLIGLIKKPQWSSCAAIVISTIIGLNVLYVGYDAVFYYPKRSAEVWQYGLREAVQYLEANKALYDRVVISHKARLHPVALAVFSGKIPGPFSGEDFPKYIMPFYHYVPIYRDFRMKQYQQYGLISRWYTMAKGKNLLLAQAGEIDDEKMLWSINNPDGTPAYEIYGTDR